MLKTIASYIVLFVFACGFPLLSYAQECKEGSLDKKNIFCYHSADELHVVIQKLHKKTNLPVLFPTMPTAKSVFFLTENEQNYIIVLEDAGSFIYNVSHEEDCDNYHCWLISISVSTTPYISNSGIPPVNETHPKPVLISLKNNEIAEFYEGDCGANCTPNNLAWKHRGYYYNIETMIGDKYSIVAIANSMLDYEEKMKQKKQ